MDIIQLEKDAAAFLGCDINDFGQPIKVHEHLSLKIIGALSRAQQKYQPTNPDSGLLAQVQALTRDNTVLKAQLDSQNKPTDASMETTPMSSTKIMNTSPPSSQGWPILHDTVSANPGLTAWGDTQSTKD